jgi:hypothetical protein
MTTPELAQLCQGELPTTTGTPAPCPNGARYIAIDGRGLCGLHALGQRAIRILDVPELVSTAGEIVDELEGTPIMRAEIDRVRTLIGRRS